MSGKEPALLLLGLDRYTLRACVTEGIPAVVVCSHTSWDRGSIEVPQQIPVLRVDDQRNAESVLSALHRAGLADGGLRGLQTSHEESVVTAAVLGRALGLNALPVPAAVALRDKSVQKSRIRAAGLRTARCRVIEDLAAVDGTPMRDFARAVLKPIAGSATRRTTFLESEADLLAQAAQVRGASEPARSYLLEEAVTGDEWLADGVVHRGELRFLALGRYQEPLLRMLNTDTPLIMYRLDPVGDADAYTRVEPVVRTALTALGLDDGVFHMELFVDDETGHVTFSECAGRRGGGLIQEEVHLKYGVDLGRAAVRVAADLDPDLRPDVLTATVGSTMISGPGGTLVSCPTPAELMTQPGVEFARLHAAYGTTLGSGRGSTTERIAETLIVADSADGVLHRADGIRRWFLDRTVVVPTRPTGRELRFWQARHWPDRARVDTEYAGPRPASASPARKGEPMTTLTFQQLTEFLLQYGERDEDVTTPLDDDSRAASLQDLGFDSLGIFNTVIRISEVHSVNLRYEDITEAKTLDDMLTMINASLADAASAG
jgi:biotin carboxylase/acyl carrier protein